MKCVKCGCDLRPDAKFCEMCGLSLENFDYINSSGKQNGETNENVSVEEPQTEFIDREQRYEPMREYAPMPPKKKSSAVLYASLSFLAVACVVVIVLLVTLGGEKTDKSGLFLSVDSYPLEVQNDNINISGFVDTSKNGATLTINGISAMSFKKNQKAQKWSYKLNLKQGTNKFILSLCDADGVSHSRMVEIVYNNPSLVYPAGTKLIKNVNDDVFIRPTPSVGDYYITYIKKADTSSTYTCLGEESMDAEEGVPWCKIMTPQGEVGWVRSDLMKIAE